MAQHPEPEQTPSPAPLMGVLLFVAIAGVACTMVVVTATAAASATDNLDRAMNIAMACSFIGVGVVAVRELLRSRGHGSAKDTR